jgi:hypothetical protein
MTDDLLPRIPGEYIADALLTLPHPEFLPDGSIMDAFVTVPGIGPRADHGAAHEVEARTFDALLLDGGERRYRGR